MAFNFITRIVHIFSMHTCIISLVNLLLQTRRGCKPLIKGNNEEEGEIQINLKQTDIQTGLEWPNFSYYASLVKFKFNLTNFFGRIQMNNSEIFKSL